MDMIVRIVFWFTLGYAAFAVYRFRRDRRRSDDAKDVFFAEVCSSVKDMNSTIEQLSGIESIINDIEICSSEHMRAVRIEIPGSLSQNSSHEIIIDGSGESTEYLLRLALSERERLRSLLIEEVSELSRYGITQTVTQTYEPSERGERL